MSVRLNSTKPYPTQLPVGLSWVELCRVGRHALGFRVVDVVNYYQSIGCTPATGFIIRALRRPIRLPVMNNINCTRVCELLSVLYTSLCTTTYLPSHFISVIMSRIYLWQLIRLITFLLLASAVSTHTHTHTHIYIYIYIYISSVGRSVDLKTEAIVLTTEVCSFCSLHVHATEQHVWLIV